MMLFLLPPAATAVNGLTRAATLWTQRSETGAGAAHRYDRDDTCTCNSVQVKSQVFSQQHRPLDEYQFNADGVFSLGLQQKEIEWLY